MKAITINPKVCNGKPVIAGTRIPVTVILDQLTAGGNVVDIRRKYPELSAAQITQALRYCHAMIEHSELEVVSA